MNSKYSFEVSVTNLANEITYGKSEVKYATTFPFKTAEFSGASYAEALPGKYGETSIRVIWTPALTGSSTFNLSETDPVGYEISYVESGEGLEALDNPTKTTSGGLITVPTNINGSMSYDSEVVISNLKPETTYLFRVRAINYGFFLDQKEKTGLNYQHEYNNVVVSAKTNAISSDYGFFNYGISAKPGDGFNALKEIDVAWSRGTGGFYGYRVFVRRICDDCETPTPCDLNIKSCTDFINSPLCENFDSSTGFGCYFLDPLKTNYSITGLQSYKKYQVLVSVCGDEGCTQQVQSEERTVETKPKIALFEGLSEIKFATTKSELDAGTIHLDFQKIDITSGYLTNLNVWCLDNPNDPKNSTVSKITELGTDSQNPVCKMANLKTSNPTNSGDWVKYKKEWSNFDEISINFGADAYGEKYFVCLGIMPEIEEIPGVFNAINVTKDGQLTDEAKNRMIVRCSTLESLQPTIEQFPGKNIKCEEGVNSLGENIPLSLRISYREPTGGIFSHYRIFIKSSSEEVFNFENAKATAINIETVSICPNGQYCYVDVKKEDPNYYDFKNLKPGEWYSTGVLPIYKIEGNDIPLYSDSNSRTSACQAKVPDIYFNEWTNILSLGPKTDARWEVQYNPDGEGNYNVIRHHLPEKLNEHGVPIEIDPTDLGLIVNKFDGVFNELGNAFSENGIIHLEWKDVKFAEEVNELEEKTELSFFDVLYSIDQTIFQIEKTDRKYGYRVYRSSDLGVTWKNLTRTTNEIDPHNKYVQKVENDGLITPCRMEGEVGSDVELCRKKYKANGGIEYTPRIVKFTDYSVQNAPSLSEVDNGRVYLYRIELIFDGKIIPLLGDDHTIKVILPPPNMAFAHRKMINRTMCLDLSKEGEFDRVLNKNPGGHYSCEYNGIGASSLRAPWSTDATVYDIGGDLIIDRFEMGCNWTRGSANDWDQTQFPDDPKTYDADTKGCVGKSYQISGDNIPLDEYPLAKSTSTKELAEFDDMRLARKGDCVGTWASQLAYDYNPDTTKGKATIPLNIPGAIGGRNYVNSDSGQTNANDPGHYMQSFLSDGSVSFDGMSEGFPMLKDYIVRSEFAAVLYNRFRDNNLIRNYYGNNYSEVSTDLGQDENFNFNKIGPKTADGNIIRHRSAEGSPLDSGCWINLGYKNNINGLQEPRWFSLNQLFFSSGIDGNEYGDLILRNTQGDIIEPGNMTIGDLKNPINNLYLNNSSDNFQIPTKPQNYNNRYFDNLNIIRLMTTNAAKAPPVVNISQEESDKICQKYKVGLVVKPSDSENVFKTLRVKNKRLPSRKEMIAYSAWPDTFSHEEITKIENRSYVGLERRNSEDPLNSHQITGCNSSEKTSPIENVPFTKFMQGKLKHGEYLTSVYPKRLSSSEVIFTLFHSGSSQMDANDPTNLLNTTNLNYNSESCVSKFGAQDIVGNLKERNADRIFCNFDKRKMYIQNKTQDGDNLNFNKAILAYSFDLSESMPADYNQFISLMAARNEGDQDFRNLQNNYFENESTEFVALVPEVESETYCSVVGAYYSDQDQIVYNNDDGSMYNPILDYVMADINDRKLIGKSFNHFNLNILNDLRNGDGSYLDFGAASSVSQKDKKSQGLLWQSDLYDNSYNSYVKFNPIVGMPLSCKTSSCDQSSDNKIFDNGVFPIGNSSFQNDGINQVTVRDRTVRLGGERIAMVTGISSSSSESWDDVIQSNLEETAVGSGEYTIPYIPEETKYRTFSFKVSQSNYFHFVSGGSSFNVDTTKANTGASAGRYSFYLRGNDFVGQQSYKNDTGFRCVVKVNENE